MDSAQGGSGLPRWTLLALVPFVVLAACAIYLRIHWNDIPMRFPVHWGANGPNRWETRSFLGVYSGLIFAAGLSASLIGAGLMSYFGSGRARAGELMLRVMVGVGCFLGLVFAGVALMPLGFRPGILAAAVPLFGLALVSVLVITASGDPDDVASRDGRPPLFVPKEIGWGYSFNFANPYAWRILGVMLGGIGASMAFLLLAQR